METTLGLEIIEVVEQAAIASARWMGKGEKNTADQVAVEAMRERMNKIHMRGRIVIGDRQRQAEAGGMVGEQRAVAGDDQGARPRCLGEPHAQLRSDAGRFAGGHDQAGQGIHARGPAAQSRMST